MSVVLLTVGESDAKGWRDQHVPRGAAVQMVHVARPEGLRGQTLENLVWTEAAERHPGFGEALRTALPCFATGRALPAHVQMAVRDAGITAERSPERRVVEAAREYRRAAGVRDVAVAYRKECEVKSAKATIDAQKAEQARKDAEKELSDAVNALPFEMPLPDDLDDGDAPEAGDQR